jgi:hypothetical protein
MGKRRCEYRVLLGKPEGKTQLANTRHKWEGSIEINLQEGKWEVYWTDLSQDRNKWRTLVSTALTF